MTTISALRAELREALTKIVPQIRGLQDFVQFIATNSELFAAVQKRLVTLEKRRDLMIGVQRTLNALEADGYPAIEKFFLPQSSAATLQSALADLTAAVEAFDIIPIITISLGEPEDK